MSLETAQAQYDNQVPETADGECLECGAPDELNKDGLCKGCVRENVRIEAAEREREERS